MHLRWIGRKRRHSKFWRYYEEDINWQAVLVESHREGGKRRQRHLAVLGSITDSAMQNVHQRRSFWDSVLDRLDMFSTSMTAEERRTIETAVAARVPRLSREEHNASVADCAYLRLPPQPPYRKPL
jgi:hypothetical protein